MISLILISLQLLFGINNGFENQLKQYLDAKLSFYEKYEFSIEPVKAAYAKIEIDDQREFKLNRNYGLVPVIVYDRRNKQSSSLITVKLKLFKKVLVANQDIGKDELISQFQFNEELREVTSIRGTSFYAGETVDMLKTKVRINSGSVLTKESTEAIPDVDNNDRLILHAGKNGVDITTEVTAREKGAVGNIIRVVSSDNKIYRAKIIDKYNVILVE